MVSCLFFFMIIRVESIFYSRNTTRFKSCCLRSKILQLLLLVLVACLFTRGYPLHRLSVVETGMMSYFATTFGGCRSWNTRQEIQQPRPDSMARESRNSRYAPRSIWMNLIIVTNVGSMVLNNRRALLFQSIRPGRDVWWFFSSGL